MPALNYQPEFGALVELGRKPHTIRPYGKRPYKVGDALHHFTGMRTKQCRRLGFDLCTQVRRIQITWGTVMIDMPAPALFIVPPLDRFARADGFMDWEDMCTWFAARYGLPFEGQLIQWAPAEWEKAFNKGVTDADVGGVP